MTSVGAALNDALYDRITSVVADVDVFYKGEQGDADDYILFLDDDERYSPETSDKSGRGNDVVVVLQLWGLKPRTVAEYAKTIIDSVYGTPLVVSGFYHIRTVLEENRAQPMLTIEGQRTQYSRIVRLRFYYHPSG